jgi:hypothetical protein
MSGAESFSGSAWPTAATMAEGGRSRGGFSCTALRNATSLLIAAIEFPVDNLVQLGLGEAQAPFDDAHLHLISHIDPVAEVAVFGATHLQSPSRCNRALHHSLPNDTR